MTDRILDISEAPARLSLENGLLIVSLADGKAAEVPLGELAVVVVSHPQVTYTQGALAALAGHGVPLITCDSKHLPVGMLMPLQAHHAQAQRFAMQASASLPTRKRAWQQVVRAKVQAQARLLRAITGSDAGLEALIARVRSGDPANVEAQAAVRYWPAVFSDPSFLRRREAEDQNRHLNYGYAILRAIVARSVCAAGLHPSLGIHHHNRSDAFCLADDLMEPLRPIVDRVVVGVVRDHGPSAHLDREAKARILGELAAHHVHGGESRSLFDWSSRMASSLASVLAGESRQLQLPFVA